MLGMHGLGLRPSPLDYVNRDLAPHSQGTSIENLTSLSIVGRLSLALVRKRVKAIKIVDLRREVARKCLLS
jgi:hypothetical protein